MKHSKISGFIGLSIILVLLVLLSPRPVQAATLTPGIFADPNYGRINERIRLYGYNFDIGENPLIYLYFSSNQADVEEGIDSRVVAYEQLENTWFTADGVFDPPYFFSVPEALTDGKHKEDVHGGVYYLYATYSESKEIVAAFRFTVLDGEIKITPKEGTVGTEVEISGKDLRKNQKISAEYDGEKVDIISGNSETGYQGQFVCTIIVPDSTIGSHTITVVDESGDRPEAEFSVKPKITLDPTEQALGQEVRVSGTGFNKNEAITLTIEGYIVATTPKSIETDRLGSFDCSIVVPFFDICGAKAVMASDEKNHRAETQLTVLAGITLSPLTSPASPGNVGMELMVRGIGFIAESDITVNYTTDGEVIPVATAIADANGQLNVKFTVPPSLAGSHTVTATDGSNSLISTFTMESQAPPTPRLLLPALASMEEAVVRFDWENVTDPSGVSYTLQVSSDANFTDIVLERKNLPQSEYVMGEGEKLAPTKTEAPYYWRVKAVDGASNESDWPSPGLFYVGSVLPGWIWYIFGGLGLLLLAFGVFWWLRRRARGPRGSGTFAPF